MQIPKLPHIFEECKTEIEQLVYIMESSDKISCHLAANQDVYLKINKLLKTGNLDEYEVQRYSAIQNLLLNHMDMIEEALNEGMHKGARHAYFSAARSLLYLGVDKEIIRQSTGLTLEEINSISI